MDNAVVEKNKKRGRFGFIFTTILVLLLLCACVTVGALGMGYLNQNNRFSNFFNFNRQNQNSNNSVDDFISDNSSQVPSDIVNLVENSQPAVVTVAVKDGPTIRGGSQLQQRETVGSGTGFFISEEGLLITNEHVVCGARASDLLIIASNDKSYTVQSIASDPSQDIAILKVDTNGEKVRTLKFANLDSGIKVGQEVIAIGNPFGDNPGSVTKGIISGLDRNITARGTCDGEAQSKDYEGVLQTDAAINSGNSGGPLINLRGEVVAVNSATLRDANNISYSVPFTTVTRILDRYLKNNNRIIQPYIGVSYRMVSANLSQSNDIPVGAYILDILENSPASRAGLRENDIITKVGDYKVEFSLVTTLNQYFEPNQETTLEVYRSANEDLSAGEIVKLEITIGEKEAE
jgi:S1-C subfamily serine protease